MEASVGTSLGTAPGNLIAVSIWVAASVPIGVKKGYRQHSMLLLNGLVFGLGLTVTAVLCDGRWREAERQSADTSPRTMPIGHE